MTTRFTLAVRNLYNIFGAYPANPSMHGSPLHTELAAWNRTLFSKPLEDLTGEDLSIFAGKAMTTWGDVSDFKHFLPRLLELAGQPDTSLDVSVLYDKLDYANWKNWKIAEQDSISEFSLAFWDSLLCDDSGPSEWEFESCFEALANFYPRFNELTAMWLENNSTASVRHLAAYVYDNFNSLFLKSSVGFDDAHLQQFRRWLLCDGVIRKLTEGFFRLEHTDMAETISESLRLLEIERQNRPSGNS